MLRAGYCLMRFCAVMVMIGHDVRSFGDVTWYMVRSSIGRVLLCCVKCGFGEVLFVHAAIGAVRALVRWLFVICGDATVMQSLSRY